MLYVTTRNKQDAHTSYRTLSADTDREGGLYVPFYLPKFTPEQIGALREKSFSQCVSEILKILFGIRLDSWDVDFCIGRYPVRLVPLPHKIVVGETWRNPDWDFARLIRNLAARLQNSQDSQQIPSSWACIAVRIAVIFGLFGELERLGLAGAEKTVDLAAHEGDLSAAVSAVYAKKMGLPIGSVVCSCSEDSPLWELLHTGQAQTKREKDTLPENLERLIYEVLGYEKTGLFIDSCKAGEAFRISAGDRTLLREAVSPVVVSQKRVDSLIPNVYRTSTYVLEPDSALAYGALLDHRSSTGERRAALLLTERSPLHALQAVAYSMNISVQELKERIYIK